MQKYRDMDYKSINNFNEDIETFLTEINEKLYEIVLKDDISISDKDEALFLDGCLQPINLFI